MLLRTFTETIYLFSIILFIIGLKFMNQPERARRGNLISGLGMLLATVGTLIDPRIKNLGWIFSAVIVGSVIGILSAKRVKISSIPSMVSFFNFVGAVSVLTISISGFVNLPILKEKSLFASISIFIIINLLISTVTISGSLVSLLKLQGFFREKWLEIPLQKFFHGFILLSFLILSFFILLKSEPDLYLFLLLSLLSFLYGILFSLPASGSQVILLLSFLNSLNGVSASLIGLIYENVVLISIGTLVGSSGFIFTIFMSRLKNISITSILLGNKSQVEEAKIAPSPASQEIDLTDAAILLAYARKLIIIPGFGMAFSGAGQICASLLAELEERDIEVKFALHPLAGRMPGHMNVLLADANISHEKIFDYDEIQDEFKTTDVVLVIGANDIINPIARKPIPSPLSGIQTFEIESAKTIIILKRSNGLGFSGIQNEVFGYEKTKMIYGDAKWSLVKLLSTIKDL
ncbi:MAG: NAD(P)(+) transhydrogenase (Re/Si-specific) subunit beta [Leptospiraceae bacterium]|nr:NAD(P)(+) transhydrogenase (Re/Si-specific) subunit beta [Leptospiraceae bacterium]